MVQVANGKRIGFRDSPGQSSWDLVHSRSLEICVLQYATASQRKIFLFIRKQIGNGNEKVLCHSKVILFYGNATELHRWAFYLILLSEKRHGQNKDISKVMIRMHENNQEPLNKSITCNHPLLKTGSHASVCGEVISL